MDKKINPQKLTIEEMIELGYSEEAIHKALDNKLKESKAAQQQKRIVEARDRAIAALRDYMIALGIPAQEIEIAELDKAFTSFERQIAPALKVLTKLPKKDEPKSTLETCALEDALAALRTFADSL